MKLETLETCIEVYGTEVYSFCRYLTRSPQEADDLYQDTFLKLLEIREQLKFERNPKGYLLSVAVHIWTNKKRKLARRQRITGPAIPLEEMTIEPEAREATPEEQLLQKEQRERVQQAVYALPEKYRLPVLLFYMEGQKIPEIAGILKLPESTVKTRLRRARMQLEKDLEVDFS